MTAPLWVRWLGIAGIELTVNGQALAIDPSFTRPAIWQEVFGRVRPDRERTAREMPHCDHVLVSHAHWDHLLDVPDVIRNTGATALGSANTCRLLQAEGIPALRIRRIQAGERLNLGNLHVQVLPAEHLRLFGRPLLTGPLPPTLKPPLRLRDYQADCYFSFLIEAAGLRLLDWCSERPEPAVEADLLFVAPYRSTDYYKALLKAVRPRAVIPIHWDSLHRPAHRPLCPMLKPPAWSTHPLERIDLRQFCLVIKRIAPGTRVLLPEIGCSYDLGKAFGHR